MLNNPALPSTLPIMISFWSCSICEMGFMQRGFLGLDSESSGRMESPPPFPIPTPLLLFHSQVEQMSFSTVPKQTFSRWTLCLLSDLIMGWRVCEIANCGFTTVMFVLLRAAWCLFPIFDIICEMHWQMSHSTVVGFLFRCSGEQNNWPVPLASSRGWQVPTWVCRSSRFPGARKSGEQSWQVSCWHLRALQLRQSHCTLILRWKGKCGGRRKREGKTFLTRK